jgi:Papain-like cysteine protease AvrRpt2
MSNVQYPVINGVQTIDYTTGNPLATANLSMPHYTAPDGFDPSVNAWNMSEPFMCELDIPDPFSGPGVIITMGLTNAGAPSASIQIIVNGTNLEITPPIPATGPGDISWYIPSSMLQPGSNQVVFQLSGSIYLSSVSVTGFVMQHQQESNWCWAAMAASVSSFYSGTDVQQCTIVNAIFAARPCDCCTNPSACNAGNDAGAALQYTGNLQSVEVGPMAVSRVAAQMGLHRPVAVRIAWSGAGAHIVALTGVSVDRTMIAVQDPWFGSSLVSYAGFPKNYHDVGASWTHSILTQPRIAA